MKKVSGYLRLLGESNVYQETKTYTAIEIGDQVMTNVRVIRSIANFLSNGVGQEVILHLDGSVIVACEVGGKIYYDSSYAPGFGVLMTLLCGGGGAFLGLAAGYLIDKITGSSLLVILVIIIGAVVGGKWGSRQFATPPEFAEWKAQGAIEL